jgi:hypothetical protein
MKNILLPKSTKGQSLVELAVSLVILLYLLSGAVEFGILFFQYVQLRDAAQEGALYGSTDPTNLQEIERRARAASDKPINLDFPPPTGLVTVEIFIDDVLVRSDGGDTGADIDDTACEAHALRVEASFEHEIFMPFMPQLIGRTEIPLTASVTDTILTPVCPP